MCVTEKIVLYFHFHSDQHQKMFEHKTKHETHTNLTHKEQEDKGNNLCVYLMEIEKDFYLFIYVLSLSRRRPQKSTSCMILTLPFICLSLALRCASGGV